MEKAESDPLDIVYEEGVDMILFANSASGSTKAKAYLNLKQSVLSLPIKDKKLNIFIYDLLDHPSRIEGTQKAKLLLESNDSLRVIVAGGDGSLIWVIETFISEEINTDRILFGILPFGSGNDLSAMLGWGRDPPDDLFAPFFEEWLIATPRNFDFWLIQCEVSESGGFGKVNKTKSSFSKSLIHENGSKKLNFRRLMSNYFSIGLDARIGLGFDKHRTTKKCCNKLMYGWEGFKKMFCCVKTPSVPELISSIASGEQVIVDNTSEELALAEDTSVLLALNIRSYAGGDNYVWEKARSHPQKVWEKQNPNDETLEFLTFHGKIGLGLEQVKCTQGQARRLHQGSGPFRINFGESNRKCYMQIDGEYYYVESPKFITVGLWEKSRDIRVLYRTS